MTHSIDDLVEYLSPFRDPGTDIEARGGSRPRGFIEFERKGRHWRLQFAGDGKVEANGQVFSRLGDLLAGRDFADIEHFRSTQRQVFGDSVNFEYIEPFGVIGVDGQQRALTWQTIVDAVEPDRSDHLSLILLDGPAGVGKTSLIQRIAASRLSGGSNLPPLLHVRSGGNQRNTLVQSLSVTTQDFDAKFKYNQVASLVHFGVLSLAIDGFDELVDPDGYKDAWFALRDFLKSIGTGGPVILAGRDTFFDQQEFSRQVQDSQRDVRVQMARLAPVPPESAKDYLVNQGWNREDVEAAGSAGWLTPNSYRLRPYFLYEIARVDNGWETLRKAFGSPQAFIVRRFIEREAALVVRSVDITPESAEAGLLTFYGMVVQDMASSELDRVDASYLSLALEIAFEDYLDETALRKISKRAASIGLLEQRGSGGDRGFPHDEVRDYFLARSIIDNLERSSAITTFLRRSTLSRSVASAAGDHFATLASQEQQRVASRVRRLLADAHGGDQLLGNMLALVLALVDRGFELGENEVGPGYCHEAVLAGSPSRLTLVDIVFGILDARGANCSLLEFQRCEARQVLVNEASLFGTTAPSVRGMLVIDGEERKEVRDSGEADEFLRRGYEEARIRNVVNWINSPDADLVRYFDRLVRKFAGQHQIRNTDNDNAYRLLQDKRWRVIRPILEEHERLRVETKTAGGSPDEFFVLSRAEVLSRPSEWQGPELAIWEQVIDADRNGR